VNLSPPLDAPRGRGSVCQLFGESPFFNSEISGALVFCLLVSLPPVRQASGGEVNMLPPLDNPLREAGPFSGMLGERLFKASEKSR